jgi:tetratricopeptide (TPR) repeat protein
MEARRLAEREAGRPLGDDEVARYWFSRGRAFLFEDPARAARLIGRKALLAVGSTEQPLEYSPRLDANPMRRLVPVPFAAFLALAVAGIAPALRRRAAQPAVIVCVATLAVLLVFYVASRYRMPMIPGLAVIAGAGGSLLAQRGREGRGRALAGAGFLAAAAISLLWFPLTQGDLAREQDAMSLSDLGTAQRGTGRLDDAIASYRRALALAPASPYAHLDLGKTFARAGRIAEAEGEARETIRLAPDLAEAHFDLGVITFESGRLDEAAACFREAFRLEPTNADAGNNLAGTYLNLGRIEDARATVRAMRASGLAVDPPLARATGD